MSVNAWSANSSPIGIEGIDHKRLHTDTEKYSFPEFDSTAAKIMELVWHRTIPPSQPDNNNFTGRLSYHGNLGEIHRDQQYQLSFPPGMLGSNAIHLTLFNKYRSLAPMPNIKGDAVGFILSNVKANNREDESDPENAYHLRLEIDKEVYESYTTFALIKKMRVEYREVFAGYQEMAKNGELKELEPPPRKGKRGPKKKKRIDPNFYQNMRRKVQGRALSEKGLVEDSKSAKPDLSMDRLLQNFMEFEAIINNPY